MKTALEIPDLLFKRAKIRAIEKGLRFRDVVITALEHELSADEGQVPLLSPGAWKGKPTLPEFEALLGTIQPETQKDSGSFLSSERDSR